jgi:ribonucleotide monophosphatase NagD (HAD superfamily)
MIGDNPHSDIQGANRAGIPSILVRTGIYEHHDKPEVHTPTHMTDDFWDAL